jgi:NitT/TauT family transport system permease protein
MRRLIAPAVLILVLLSAWELACRTLDVPAYFLPPPSAVAVSLVERAPLLAGAALQTFRMALQALFVAALLGAGLALGVSLNRTAEAAVRRGPAGDPGGGHRPAGADLGGPRPC